MNAWFKAAVVARIAPLLGWPHWPAIGHISTVLAALAAVAGIAIASYNNRNQLRLNQEQLQLSETEQRTNWECNFLYHQEENLSRLDTEGGRMAGFLGFYLQRRDQELSIADISDRAERKRRIAALGKNPAKLQEVDQQVKPDNLLPRLLEFQGEIASNQYLFRSESFRSIEELNSELGADALTSVDLDPKNATVLRLHEKIRSELTCARFVLRNTCDPESADNAPIPATWCPNSTDVVR